MILETLYYTGKAVIVNDVLAYGVALPIDYEFELEAQKYRVIATSASHYNPSVMNIQLEKING